MDVDSRRSLIARYKQGYEEVLDALEGASEAELDASRGPDDWSARQIVHHLADSEMTSAIRLRRLLAEDAPVIAGYDQDEFARRLHYDRPLDASLAAFYGARVSSAELLDQLADEDWARTGSHSESGPYGVETWLSIYADHAFDHALQIREARKSAR